MSNKLLSLTSLDKAIVFIQKASIAQLDELISQAEAVRVYASQSKKGLVLQNQAVEIKLRAERKLSEWLEKQPRNKGAANAVTGVQRRVPTLKEIGFERIKVHRLKAIASLPKEDFEEHIKKVKSSNEELTTMGIIKLAKELEKSDRISKEKKCRNEKVSTLDIRKGDFRKVLDDLKHIDAIITDPPYPKEFLPLFSDLSKFASKKLKEDGFIAIYSGQYHLPEVINRLSEHLTYVWTFCLYHVGKKQLVNGVNIMCGWKPVLIFSKGKKKMRFSAYDVLISEVREKHSHKWQQSESGVESLIEIFSKPGNLIVDPFAGSGSFGVVANKLGRKFIGAEINDKT